MGVDLQIIFERFVYFLIFLVFGGIFSLKDQNKEEELRGKKIKISTKTDFSICFLDTHELNITLNMNGVFFFLSKFSFSSSIL